MCCNWCWMLVNLESIMSMTSSGSIVLFLLLFFVGLLIADDIFSAQLLLCHSIIMVYLSSIL